MWLSGNVTVCSHCHYMHVSVMVYCLSQCLFYCCRHVTSSSSHISYNSQLSAWERPTISEEQNGICYVMTFLRDWSKTKSFVFSWKQEAQLSQKDHAMLCVYWNLVNIGNVTICDYLGVILDAKRSWKQQVETKFKKALALMCQLRRVTGATWGMTPKTVLVIYCYHQTIR